MSKQDIMLEFIRKVKDFELPSWEKLPELDLYMDQIITYISRAIQDVSEKNSITDSMVNNYVKGKIIPPPTQKKYNIQHISSLFGIAFLKSILSFTEIKKIFEGTVDNGIYYNDLRQTQINCFNHISQTMATQIADIDLEDKTQIKILAIELAIQAYASKIYAMQLLSLIESKEEKVEDKKHDSKKSEIEKKSLGEKPKPEERKRKKSVSEKKKTELNQ